MKETLLKAVPFRKRIKIYWERMIALKSMNYKMTGLALLTVLIAATTLFALDVFEIRAAGETKIGFVDLQAVFEDLPQKKEAQKAYEDYLKQIRAEYEQKMADADDAEKRRLAQELDKKVSDKNNELVAPIDNAIRKALEQVVKERGITVVLHSMVRVYGGEDLTKAVYERTIELLGG